MEVVVMLFACELIAGGLSRNFNRGEPPVLDQGLDIPINGGDPDTRVVLKGAFQGFFGRQRPICLSERIPYGGLLFGISLLHH